MSAEPDPELRRAEEGIIAAEDNLTRIRLEERGAAILQRNLRIAGTTGVLLAALGIIILNVCQPEQSRPQTPPSTPIIATLLQMPGCQPGYQYFRNKNIERCIPIPTPSPIRKILTPPPLPSGNPNPPIR